MGPRTSTVLIERARTICIRVAVHGQRGPGYDVDAALARAIDLALTARDRRIDWNGPTGEPLAIAAQAIARAGDPSRGLRLLLPPPRGSARPGEATSPVVIASAAELAFMTGDADLALELAPKVQDPVERRLIEAFALIIREETRLQAVTAFRSLLSDLASDLDTGQKIRALLGLAMVSELDEHELAFLTELDPSVQDLIRAQSLMSAGRVSEAQILVRPYRGSGAATQIRVQVLLAQGRVGDAIAALEAYGAEHGEERLFLQAAGLALSAGLLGEVERLASRVAGSTDASRRQASAELLLTVAQQRADWQRVLAEADRLLANEDGPANDPDWDQRAARYRWARVNAYYQQRDAVKAYGAIEEEAPLEATNPDEARLLVAVLRAVAPLVVSGPGAPRVSGRELTQGEVLRRASAVAQQFPDEEEVVAAALAATLSLPVEDPVDPSELIEAQRLQRQFLERFPESQIIRAMPVPDSAEGMASMLKDQLAPSAGLLHEMRRRVYVGQVPLSTYAAAAQRSYAQGLAQNAAGCYVIQSVDAEINTREIAAAIAALDETVVIDTSSLFFSELVFGDRSALRRRFDRLVLPAPLRDDILAARASLTLHSSGSFGWDPVTNKPVFSLHDEDLTGQWAAEAGRLAETLEFCDVLPDAPFDGDPRNRVWSSSIRLAKQLCTALVADDVALRNVARAEGVEAFGSLQLLAALISDGTVAAGVLEAVYQRLRTVRAADLPLLDRLVAIAEEEDWKPNGYAAFLLTRPITWLPPTKGTAAYMSLLRAEPERNVERVAGWYVAAAYGLALVTPPQLVPLAISSLIAATTIEWRGPEALPALLARTDRLVAEFAPDADILKDVVQRIVRVLRQIVPAEHVSGIVLALLSGLQQDVRHKAVGHFLAVP